MYCTSTNDQRVASCNSDCPHVEVSLDKTLDLKALTAPALHGGQSPIGDCEALQFTLVWNTTRYHPITYNIFVLSHKDLHHQAEHPLTNQCMCLDGGRSQSLINLSACVFGWRGGARVPMNLSEEVFGWWAEPEYLQRTHTDTEHVNSTQKGLAQW